MAERQGLLVGKYLSTVQVRAIQILNLLDEVRKQEDRFALFRAALTASGSYDAAKVWPEYEELFSDTNSVDIDDPRAADPNANYDYSQVEWKGTEAKQEYDELIAKVAGLQKGRINGSSLTRGM